MNMKKYTADTMVEAMKKVRTDFGDDAIILSSKVVHSKGFLGFFQKKSVEVVAGYDPPQQQQEMAYDPIQHTPKQVDNSTLELKNEMAEMKKLLKNIQIPSAISHYPDEMQPLLTTFTETGLVGTFYNRNCRRDLQ